MSSRNTLTPTISPSTMEFYVDLLPRETAGHISANLILFLNLLPLVNVSHIFFAISHLLRNIRKYWVKRHKTGLQGQAWVHLQLQFISVLVEAKIISSKIEIALAKDGKEVGKLKRLHSSWRMSHLLTCNASLLPQALSCPPSKTADIRSTICEFRPPKEKEIRD